MKKDMSNTEFVPLGDNKTYLLIGDNLYDRTYDRSISSKYYSINTLVVNNADRKINEHTISPYSLYCEIGNHFNSSMIGVSK